MKVLNTPIVLIDCGRASKSTRGLFTGPFTEAVTPPANHWGH
jgi:hypothetical protein